MTFGVSASSFAANMAVCESREVHPISDAESYTKTLGLEWNVKTDTFRLTVANHPSSKNGITLAKAFDSFCQQLLAKCGVPSAHSYRRRTMCTLDIVNYHKIYPPFYTRNSSDGQLNIFSFQ